MSGGQDAPQADQRHHADDGHHPEGRTPAGSLAERGAQRHAEDVGQGQAGEHQGDGGSLAVGRHQTGGDHRTDAEEGAVAERGDHPGEHQQAVVGGHRAEEIADDEDAHQHQQGAFARQPCGKQRHDRRAERHAEGIAADQPAGAGNGHAEIGGNIGQQPHDDEFRGADGKRGQSEDEKRSGHAPAPEVESLGRSGPCPRKIGSSLTTRHSSGEGMPGSSLRYA
ncbi:hypothetical protein D9M71_460770 [compost metagenome]